jgi:mannose-6-phosphate isomerase
MPDLHAQPLFLIHNKFVRPFNGGREIDRFRSITSDTDDGRPESWVGSCTKVNNADCLEDKNSGLAQVMLPDGDRLYLIDLVARNAEGYLGAAHVRKYGSQPHFLVKILDAGQDLLLQAHPPRDIARRYYNLPGGKHECWYVLGTRSDVKAPSLVLGFKPGISREIYDTLFDAQDFPGMRAWCHKIPVQTGDMYNVPNGLVHAIGEGCFIIEVQEPSDVTAFVDKRRAPAGMSDSPQWREKMLQAFTYEGMNMEQTIAKYKVAPVFLQNANGYSEKILIGKAQHAPFGAIRYDMDMRGNGMQPLDTGTCSILIVLEGSGVIRYSGGEKKIKKADEVFLPTGIRNMEFVAEGKFSIIRCFPPDAV